MTDTNLPQIGGHYRLGETNVTVIGLSKRGRGYQVHVLIEDDATREHKMRLKDFNKKAAIVNA